MDRVAIRVKGSTGAPRQLWCSSLAYYPMSEEYGIFVRDSNDQEFWISIHLPPDALDKAKERALEHDDE